MHKVPVLITLDVDPCPNLVLAIDRTLDLLAQFNIPATFFYTAAYAEKETLQKILRDGHEIGCHGLHHNDEEEFHKLSESTAQQILGEATIRLKSLLGKPLYSFRSPRVKTSSTTMQVLEKLGYRIDSSVCSQRLDFLSSNLINPGWLISPRKPYHPSSQSPYRRGNMKLWEVPVSAVLLPFVSTTLRIFGVSFMKLLFTLLYWESKWTKKPIVYLLHPHELVYSQRIPFSWKLLVPNRSWLIRGFPIRVWMGRRYLGKEVFEMNRRLFAWIAKRGDVHFFTMQDYVANIDPNLSHRGPP